MRMRQLWTYTCDDASPFFLTGVPPEAESPLSILEEAAGTRMFEDKKNASVRTMGKKEDKVKEIDRILMEDITPNMKKLKDQRDQYQEWSKNNQQFKRDERFVIAFDYSLAVEALEEKKMEREKITLILQSVQEKIQVLYVFFIACMCN